MILSHGRLLNGEGLYGIKKWIRAGGALATDSMPI